MESVEDSLLVPTSLGGIGEGVILLEDSIFKKKLIYVFFPCSCTMNY